MGVFLNNNGGRRVSVHSHFRKNVWNVRVSGNGATLSYLENTFQ